MWDRTVTICSAGKTFSVTGWKLGWAYGPAHLVRNLCVAHQYALHFVVTPIQVNSFIIVDWMLLI
jgi:aspartate/methionine/tyrosine aminotransferase